MTQSNLPDSSNQNASHPVDAQLTALKSAFEALPDPIYLFDQDRSLDYLNKAASEFNGAGGEPQAGWRCCDMFWRAEEDGQCAVDRAMQSGTELRLK